MNKILLCDANFSTIPIFKALRKEKQNHITVLGSKIDDPLHSLANVSVNINYSKIDILTRHIDENNYDCLVPGCNDMSYMALAFIAEKKDFKGFDKYHTALIIHHKDKFREFAKEKKYPIPKAINNPDKIDAIKFPVLIKPIDSFSGKGIYKAHNKTELKKYWNEAKSFSPNKTAIIEEFIEGKLYSHSAFIKKGKIIIDFFVNEYCTIYPYQVNSSSISKDLNLNIEKELKIWTEEFAKDLDLCDGLIHTQFISDNKSFYIIEVTRRSPGDLYSELIRKSTGIDYAELYVSSFCSKELPDNIKISKESYISRHTVSTDKECIFISSNINIASKQIQNIQLKTSGEKMKAAPFDKSGIYFIEHLSKTNMRKLTPLLKDFISIESMELEDREGLLNEKV